LKRQVHARELRTAEKVERNLARLVRPQIGAMSIYDVRRRHVIALLDDIEDNNGAPMADQVLSNLRSAFAWWASRDEDFSSPLVASMRRTKPKELVARP
jgi:integrase-like protein